MPVFVPSSKAALAGGTVLLGTESEFVRLWSSAISMNGEDGFMN